MASTPDAVSAVAESTLNGPSSVQGDHFYLVGEVDDELRDRIVIPLTQRVQELMRWKGEPTITLHVESNGGDSRIMWQIIELMELAKREGVKVRTIVLSHAWSAGSMIAVTGTKGERYIGRRAEHLPHYGSISTGQAHTPLQVERDKAYAQRHLATILAHYETNCKIPNLSTEMMDDGFWVPAKKAIAWSMADRYADQLPA